MSEEIQIPDYAEPAPVNTGKVHGPNLPTPREFMEEHNRARHDQLTGLLNQEAMNDAVAGRVRMAEQDKARPAFFEFDVDEFKDEVNDRYGHPFGNELLKAIAKMLKSILRHEDIAGRMGGDEFGILFDLIPKPAGKQEGNLERRADDEKAPWHVFEGIEARIKQGINELFEQEEFAHLKERGVNISYGASIWKPGMSAEQMIKEADVELYKVKQNKPGTRGVKSPDNTV